MTDQRSVALTQAALTRPRVCPDCGQPVINPGAHAEACPGNTTPAVARKIAAGGAFVDLDAVMVARAYLRLLEETA